MRVLYFCESYRPNIGGLETLSEHLIHALVSRGHAIVVVTNQIRPSDAEHAQDGLVAIHRLPMSWALAERRIDVLRTIVTSLTGLVQRFAPDVAHVAWSGPSDFFHWRSAGALPTVVTLHAHLPEGPSRDALLSRARRVVGVSSVVGVADVVPNGYPDPAAPLVAPPAAPVVLALGRMVREKGFDLLVDAWPLVRARVPEARLVLAGDGPERPRLCGDGIESLGWVAPERVHEVVDGARLVAIPSRWQEPFGLVALDAAWRERPVVAARRGGLVDIVVDGQTGLLVEPEHREAMVDAIVTLLTDETTARAMGRAARARALEHFTLDRMVNAYEQIYREIA